MALLSLSKLIFGSGNLRPSHKPQTFNKIKTHSTNLYVGNKFSKNPVFPFFYFLPEDKKKKKKPPTYCLTSTIMYLLSTALPLLAFLYTFVIYAAEMPTSAQVGLGKISGRVYTPEAVGTHYLTSTLYQCIDGHNSTRKMQYWQIEYYNIHLDTTFVMDDSFPDKRRLW